MATALNLQLPSTTGSLDTYIDAVNRMPPGPGSLIVTDIVMPSSGCSLIANTFGVGAPLSPLKIECGTSRN